MVGHITLTQECQSLESGMSSDAIIYLTQGFSCDIFITMVTTSSFSTVSLVAHEQALSACHGLLLGRSVLTTHRLSVLKPISF